MYATLFANIALMFAMPLVQKETIKTGFSHKSVHKQEVFASKTTCDKLFPIGGKRYHTNQSQSYMANHVILSQSQSEAGRVEGGQGEGQSPNKQEGGGEDSDPLETRDVA